MPMLIQIVATAVCDKCGRTFEGLCNDTVDAAKEDTAMRLQQAHVAGQLPWHVDNGGAVTCPLCRYRALWTHASEKIPTPDDLPIQTVNTANTELRCRVVTRGELRDMLDNWDLEKIDWARIRDLPDDIDYDDDVGVDYDDDIPF